MEFNVVYIKDDDGNEHRFEVLLEYEHEDQTKFLILQDPEDEENCFLVRENGEELEPVEDEEELSNAAEILEALSGEGEGDA